MSRKPTNPVKFGAVERTYIRQLREVARVVGNIVNGFHDVTPTTLPPMLDMLRRYSDMLTPWATTVAGRMLADVNVQDAKAWRAQGDRINRAMERELRFAPTGRATKQLLDTNVTLIKSLPIEAGRRAQELALKAVERGARYAEFVEEIQNTGHVTASRATLIARTETSRAASTFTRVRAEAVGAVSYVWQTSRDGAVRPSHKDMQGRIVFFNDPPTLDNLTGHAGCLPNCRCWQQIILPE